MGGIFSLNVVEGELDAEVVSQPGDIFQAANDFLVHW